MNSYSDADLLNGPDSEEIKSTFLTELVPDEEFVNVFRATEPLARTYAMLPVSKNVTQKKWSKLACLSFVCS